MLHGGDHDARHLGFQQGAKEFYGCNLMSKNVAIIFAGGTGHRMHSASVPKQFLEHKGKPIIIYTLEGFDRHPQIDGIVVACLEEWIPKLRQMVLQFGISKVVQIVPGGASGQASIYNGLVAAEDLYGQDDIIALIHDGVRPLITAQTISDNIRVAHEQGCCITTAPTTETFVIRKEDGCLSVSNRAHSFLARAPQSFYLRDILSAHRKAMEEQLPPFIDCCTLMSHYGYKMGLADGPIENIKITTDIDFCTFKAYIDMAE